MEDEVDEDYMDALKEVKGKRSILRLEHKMKRNKRAFPRGKDTLEQVAEDLEDKGIDSTHLHKRVSA
jgi:hypothetical protein